MSELERLRKEYDAAVKGRRLPLHPVPLEGGRAMTDLGQLRKEYDAAVKGRHGKIGATGLEIRADALIAALLDEVEQAEADRDRWIERCYETDELKNAALEKLDACLTNAENALAADQQRIGELEASDG